MPSCTTCARRQDRHNLTAMQTTGISYWRSSASVSKGPTSLAAHSSLQQLARIASNEPNVVRLKQESERQKNSQTMTFSLSRGSLRNSEFLGGTLQEASNHLRRVPRQIRGYLPRHTAVEKRGAVRLFFRFSPSHWNECQVSSHTRRHCRIAYLLSALIASWRRERRGGQQI